MSFDPSIFDIRLLKQHPDKFFVGCQPFIMNCVNYYTGKRMFHSSEKEDIKQMVNEQLLKSMPAIIHNFRETSDLRTYIGAIIQNICLKIYRDRAKEPRFASIEQLEMPGTDTPALDLLIHDELERWHVIMILFHRKRYKFLLCTKLYLSQDVTERDIIRALPAANKTSINRLMRTSDRPLLLEEVFQQAAKIFSRFEKKSIVGETLKRWTQRNIEIALRLLNGDPPTRSHNEETLKILIEQYTQSENYHK